MKDGPEFDRDLYCDAAIADPYPLYRTIRDLGPAVWLRAHGVWAISRFNDVRAALRADHRLVSGAGVAMNDLANAQASRNTLISDGDIHRQLRAVLMKPMLPSALQEVQAELQTVADNLVEQLMSQRSFDGMRDCAQHLPVEVISRLVGLAEDGRQRMRAWAAATFDALGPMNDRREAAIPTVMEMLDYARGIEPRLLRPDGWAMRLVQAADAGQCDASDVLGLLLDYIAPSLDTTILSMGHLLFQFGRNPKQWERVRASPDELIPRAVDEALRFEAPIRAFTRRAVEDYDVEGTRIAAGDRVLIIFASANRDERRYTDPDHFDVTRDARDHLSFGYGVHRCAGAYLAELEMQSLLRAMVTRVRQIEVGEPVVALNNVLRGYRTFRASFH
jgi:cytochrome P450